MTGFEKLTFAGVGVCPVVCLPSSIDVEYESGNWKVIKEQPTINYNTSDIDRKNNKVTLEVEVEGTSIDNTLETLSESENSVKVKMLDNNGNAIVNDTTTITKNIIKNTQNLAEITNENIGEYIDLGLSLVGTEATTDDWRILYVDTEGEFGNSGNIYVMLDDYLPNSTGYAEAVGLVTEGTHQVTFSGTKEDVYDFYKKLQNNWTALATDIGIVGATVAGVPTDRLIQSSYNYKNNTNIDFTTNPAATISGDIWVKPENGEVSAYWFEYGQNNTDTILAIFGSSSSGRCYYKV